MSNPLTLGRPRNRPARARSGGGRGQGAFVVVCLLPAVVLYVIFMVWPTIQVFRMSLYQWTGFGGTPVFIGFDNFRALATDDQFIQAFQNTILLLVIVTIISIAGALAIASVLTREKIRARSTYRFLLYLPSVLSIVVVAGIFSAVYDQSNGLINGTLSLLTGGHDHGPVWLGDERIVLYSIAIAMVWQSLGYYIVLYMAGMSTIPEEIYEAAALDGAGRLQQFTAISLPLVWGTLRTSLTFFILSSINLSFVMVKALTSGGPSGSSEVLLDYMYKQAFLNSSYGYGMAIGVVIFIFSFGFALLVSRATKREAYQL